MNKQGYLRPISRTEYPKLLRTSICTQTEDCESLPIENLKYSLAFLSLEVERSRQEIRKASEQQIAKISLSITQDLERKAANLQEEYEKLKARIESAGRQELANGLVRMWSEFEVFKSLSN
jgi:hypothetical protein